MARKWLMFPDPTEQQRLIALPAGDIFPLLEIDPDIKHFLVTSAVYDLIYAAEDEAKARALLALAVEKLGKDAMIAAVVHQALFACGDTRTKLDEHERFLEVCAEVLGVTAESLKEQAEPDIASAFVFFMLGG